MSKSTRREQERSYKEQVKAEVAKALEGKSKWYKFKYYAYYNYKAVIVAIIALILVISLVKTIVNHKDNVLSLAMFNANMDVNYNQMMDDFATEMGVTSKQEMTVDYSYVLDAAKYDYQTEQKFFMSTSIGEVDVVIAPESVFLKYAEMGYFIDWNKSVDDSVRERYADRILDVTLNEDFGNIVEASGVMVSGYGMVDRDGWYKDASEPVYMGITIESKQIDNAIAFLDHINK